MAIVQCSHGHYYDDTKNDFCPMCRRAEGDIIEDPIDRTLALMPDGEVEQQEIHLTGQGVEVSCGEDCEKTVALSPGEEDWQRFLTGWVVCVKGPLRGKDFRVFRGFNRIGRDPDSDICILDPTVSGYAHCSVVYDDRSNQFYLVPGKGTATYLRGNMLQKAEMIRDGERFCIGNSELELAVFCKGEHVWKTI